MRAKRVALVTGSSRGIGRATVLRLADTHDGVVVHYRRDGEAALASVLTFGVGTNVVIAVVNALPFPSLDGGRIVASVRGTISARRRSM